MKTKRKPRWRADPSTLYRMMGKVQPFTPHELMELELPIRMSFEALRKGHGTEQDFYDLVAALNSANMRGSEVAPECVVIGNAGVEAMRRMYERHQRTGQWGFDGPALAEVEATINLFEQLISLSTPLQMLKSMERVNKARAASGAGA